MPLNLVPSGDTALKKLYYSVLECMSSGTLAEMLIQVLNQFTFQTGS